MQYKFINKMNMEFIKVQFEETNKWLSTIKGQKHGWQQLWVAKHKQYYGWTNEQSESFSREKIKAELRIRYI